MLNEKFDLWEYEDKGAGRYPSRFTYPFEILYYNPDCDILSYEHIPGDEPIYAEESTDEIAISDIHREYIEENIHLIDPDMERDEWAEILFMIRRAMGNGPDARRVMIKWSQRGRKWDGRPALLAIRDILRKPLEEIHVGPDSIFIRIHDVTGKPIPPIDFFRTGVEKPNPSQNGSNHIGASDALKYYKAYANSEPPEPEVYTLKVVSAEWQKSKLGKDQLAIVHIILNESHRNYPVRNWLTISPGSKSMYYLKKSLDILGVPPETLYTKQINDIPKMITGTHVQARLVHNDRDDGTGVWVNIDEYLPTNIGVSA